jgi:hypothetical protein
MRTFKTSSDKVTDVIISLTGFPFLRGERVQRTQEGKSRDANLEATSLFLAFDLAGFSTTLSSPLVDALPFVPLSSFRFLVTGRSSSSSSSSGSGGPE